MAKIKPNELSDTELSDLRSVLNDEATRRATLHAQKVRENEDKISRLVFKHLPLFTKMMSHSRNNCSDTSLVNGYIDNGAPRCLKCFLLSLEADDLNDTLIHVNLRIEELG